MKGNMEVASSSISTDAWDLFLDTLCGLGAIWRMGDIGRIGFAWNGEVIRFN